MLQHIRMTQKTCAVSGTSFLIVCHGYKGRFIELDGVFL